MISCSKTNKLDDINEILLFGDSLMSGYGLKENQALSIILENDLKEAGYNIKVVNGSVSGDTSEDGLDRIEEYTSYSDIDLIVLGLGANDMLRRINPVQTERNLRKIIEIIKAKNIKIILAGMKASPTNGFAYKKKFDDIFIKNLENYDEILLIGSGKGVVSVSKIENNAWKRKSMRIYKKLFKIYNKEIFYS